MVTTVFHPAILPPGLHPLSMDAKSLPHPAALVEASDRPTMNPTDVAPGRGRFSPVVIMLMGRRNAGKTYSMTLLAQMAKERYRRWGWDKVFKVASNYHLTVANGMCSQYIIDDIMGYPDWAKNLYLCIDEIQTAALNRRPMSATAVGLSGFLTMIRKRRIECSFTTQFPQTIDYQVLLQVDLFIETEIRRNGHEVVWYIHDFWGQWTGKNWRKRWPPPRIEADQVKKILVSDPHAIFRMYDTDEVIAPVYLKERRDELIEREYELRGWQHELPMEEAQKEHERQVAAGTEPAANKQTLDEYIENLQGGILLNDILDDARDIDPTITNVTALARRLGVLGRKVAKRKGTGGPPSANLELKPKTRQQQQKAS